MNPSKNIFRVCIFSAIVITLHSCSKDKESAPVPVTNNVDTTRFVESIAQSWIDTVTNTRKVVLANVAGTNQVIGTDQLLGDAGAINLNGILNNFSISYTVVIKYQPLGYTKWYIDYAGTITDTSESHKRIVVYSPIDTLYLKPN